MHKMTKVERKEFADTTRVYIVERNSQASEKFQVTMEKTHLETLSVTRSFFAYKHIKDKQSTPNEKLFPYLL